MGKFSKRKGYRVENQLVKKIKIYGIECRRQPMSGAIPDFPFDIEIQEPRMSIEVKARANGEGFKTLENGKELPIYYGCIEIEPTRWYCWT